MELQGTGGARNLGCNDRAEPGWDVAIHIPEVEVDSMASSYSLAYGPTDHAPELPVVFLRWGEITGDATRGNLEEVRLAGTREMEDPSVTMSTVPVEVIQGTFAASWHAAGDAGCNAGNCGAMRIRGTFRDRLFPF